MTYLNELSDTECNNHMIAHKAEIIKAIANAWRSLLPKLCGSPNDPKMIVFVDDPRCDPYISLCNGLLDIFPAKIETKTIRGTRLSPGYVLVAYEYSDHDYMTPPTIEEIEVCNSEHVQGIVPQVMSYMWQIVAYGYQIDKSETAMAEEWLDG